jgi:NAD(P)-dependent dehydrogenase (short-subunit alcohol dehydrogenase family)
MTILKSLKVFIAARDPHRCTDCLGPAVHESGGEWAYQVADVSIWENQVAVFETLVKRWGRIDYVFANAGVGERVWLPSHTPKEGEFVKPNLMVSP